MVSARGVALLRVRSKVDGWLSVALIGGAVFSVGIVLIVLGAGVASAGPQALWSGLVLIPIVIIGAGLPMWLLRATYYEVAASHLKVVSGPFRWTIAIAEINSITRTRNPLSSPALSLDRLRIQYGRGRAIMISPENEEVLLDALRQRGWRGEFATR